MPHLTGLDLPFSFYAISAFALGLIFGSFLNVVIHRVPRGVSIVFPGSHCAACGAPIKTMDNIPLVSYALLGGRCRSCRARISFSYPMTELLTGLIFVAIVFKSGPSWEALPEFAFACVMIALVFIDARHHLLPNVITYPAFLFALAGATARATLGERSSLAFDISILIPNLLSEFTPWRAALFGGSLFAVAATGFWMLDKLDPILFGKYFDWEESDENPPNHNRALRATIILGVIMGVMWAAMIIFFSANNQPVFEDAYSGLLRASAGAMISGGLIWSIRAIYFFIRGFEGMGLGDVKMMSVVGAFLGFSGALGVLLIGSIIGSVVGLIFVYRGKRGFKTPLPFGVFLGVASLIMLLTAAPFSDWLY
jgi:leader peptidase (prepilin peptidase) / N-methyltransferase